MSRRSLSLPLTLIAAFAALLILLMSGLLPSAVMVAQVSSCPTAGFPANDPVYPNLSYTNCKATQQAEQAGPSATNTTSSGGGGGGGNNQPAQATATATITRTVTSTAGTAQATATNGATRTPTLTRAPVDDAPSATPTSELPPGVEALACVPGETVRLTGEAEPGVALLAYFADRPVGGGFARADGQFTIDLLIGEERPGFYMVEVRERATRALVAEFGCEVPTFTPTPTRIIVP